MKPRSTGRSSSRAWCRRLTRRAVSVVRPAATTSSSAHGGRLRGAVAIGPPLWSGAGAARSHGDSLPAPGSLTAGATAPLTQRHHDRRPATGFALPFKAT
jgi:hypothetical protein